MPHFVVDTGHLVLELLFKHGPIRTLTLNCGVIFSWHLSRRELPEKTPHSERLICEAVFLYREGDLKGINAVRRVELVKAFSQAARASEDIYHRDGTRRGHACASAPGRDFAPNVPCFISSDLCDVFEIWRYRPHWLAGAIS